MLQITVQSQGLHTSSLEPGRFLVGIAMARLTVCNGIGDSTHAIGEVDMAFPRRRVQMSLAVTRPFYQ